MRIQNCRNGKILCAAFSMTENKSILIKNIYYMLTYAFHVLKQSNYDEVASEQFDKIEDLFAAILSKGIAQQLKQGLYREYTERCENLSVMRGKLGIEGTIRNKLQRKQKLSCEYDELTQNNVFNSILKTTATLLMHQPSVDKERRKALKKVMLFFEEVDSVEISAIKWGTLQYRRSNQSYRMLMNICYFVLEGLLLSTEKGAFSMASFLDEQRMSTLYEKFVLEYYRYHHPRLKASSSRVDWNIDDGIIGLLPNMQTDIMLTNKEKTLIIDTKYYSRTMQTRAEYNSRTLHSGNLYQIFAYIKNHDVHSTGNTSGMLLYAKTEEEITPDCDFKMSGNKISVKTLDLNVTFEVIEAQLNHIVLSRFNDCLNIT